jgi:hypothetical protein
MYSVEPQLWVRVTYMNFVGVAARWLSSLEESSRVLDWHEFCRLLLERFGKDEHEALIRKLFRIRQTASVAEYVDQFSQLMDNLVAYDKPMDPLYFVQRFVDGLRSDIRAIVLLQRPSSVDTACVLALLQEEVAMPEKRMEFRRPSVPVLNSSLGKQPLPLPLPPRGDRNVSLADDVNHTEPSRIRASDDKMAGLHAYRRARGLCQRCAEKWSRDHQCPPTVQLHALQEVWGLFSEEDDVVSVTACVQDTPVEPQCLAVSLAAVQGNEANQTIKFQGLIQNIPVCILLDSGSSHSFIAARVASQLSVVTKLLAPVVVQVADGTRLKCSHQIKSACWSLQECVFITDLCVLDLPVYDIIVGMDWLSSYSPMHIHWLHKWVCIPYQQSLVTLYGVSAVLQPGAVVQVATIAKELPRFNEMSLPTPMVQLLSNFLDVFEPPTGMPPIRDCDHVIPLIVSATPVHVRPYRYPPAIKDEIERQIAIMLDTGIIQASSSSFSSSVLLVKKKDGTWRFCVDFRHLNAITVKMSFLVPVIEELLDELGQASWFTSLDLIAGYHQIRLHSSDTHKTAFQTHSGQYEFRVIAPATFQRAMNATLSSLLRRCVLVFFDDILIYSTSFEQHIEHVQLVLELLRKDHWQIKLSKCKFAQQQLAYLGHIISAAGVSIDPEKIKAVAKWTSPTNVKELRSFLGLAGYYRRFVRNFGVIAKPITSLLKKGVLFVWTSSHEYSFTALKEALVSAPVLSLPNFNLPFILETDASNIGVGAVLMQAGHPIAYLSKALCPRNQGLSTCEKEFLAIILAVDHWRHYLQLKEFIIHTNHRSLAQLDEQRLHTPWQKKMFTRLLGLQYRIVYKKGIDNGAADALSRNPQMSSDYLAISSCTPQWVSEIIDSYTHDPFAKDLLVKLVVDASAVPHYSLRDGLLRYKRRIWVGQSAPLQDHLIAALHASAVGGHSGFPVTYARLKQLFAWKGMKKAVEQFVSHCLICQQSKADRARLPGLLQPEREMYPWDISIRFW